MKAARKHFSHDFLLSTVRTSIAQRLKESTKMGNNQFSSIDCLMSGLAVFTFKCPSLLQFDEKYRQDEEVKNNLKALFNLDAVPCDTQMRKRLDDLSPTVLRRAFTRLFALLQRAKVLEHFRFLEKYLLVSLDGTGFFSSHEVHCNNCCVKEHRNGTTTYYHQMLTAAVVHPSQKVVFPLAPEPIMKADGSTKNDCERNASKRWVEDFRREHPHLPVVILADGLSSNGPFINMLMDHGMHYIIVAQESDHAFLTDWVKCAEAPDLQTMTLSSGSIHQTFQWMNKVPLNETQKDLHVNVLRFEETNIKTNKRSKWMWVTDLELTEKTVPQIMKGGRARWKTENEVHNTLKNQGYNFEHNYGHGYQNLSTIFAYLMMVAFLIDQCLQQLNKRWQQAYAKCGSKSYLWEIMRSLLRMFDIASFELLYEAIIRPPPRRTLSDLIVL
jgi:hypothetical protein